MKLIDCLGKRVLYEQMYTHSPAEAYVVEISPSGKMVKMEYQDGTTQWLTEKETDRIQVKEILDNINNEEPNTCPILKALFSMGVMDGECPVCGAPISDEDYIPDEEK